MLADRIMVMHKGQIVEHGDADQIMQNPENPYTQKLLASLPCPTRANSSNTAPTSTSS